MQEGVGKNQILEVPLTDTMSAYSRQFPEEGGNLSEWMDEIHTRGIQEVVFWGTKSEASGWKNSQVFRDLVKKLQEDKIRLSTMDGAKFRSSPDSARKLDRFLRSHLGSVLVCYSENESNEFVKLMQEILSGKKEGSTKAYTPYSPNITSEKPKKKTRTS